MAQTTAKQPLRILVVDDDDIFLRTLEAVLMMQGHIVSTARNGLSALKKLQLEQFDLVVTDLNMPGMNGLELLEKIDSEKMAVTPILMSSLLSREIKTYAASKGAYANLDKPFPPSRLFSLIESSRQEGPKAANQG